MQVNGYMIKEALSLYERKLKSLVINPLYAPILKQDRVGNTALGTPNLFSVDRSEREVTEIVFNTAMVEYDRISDCISKLYDAQREYNQEAGIFKLLDARSVLTKKITLLAPCAGFRTTANPGNDGAARNLSMSSGPVNIMITLQSESAVDCSVLLDVLRAKEVKIKNKIGIANTKMFEVEVDQSLFEQDLDQ